MAKLLKKAFILLTAVLAVACSDEQSEPKPVEKLAGSWAYESNELSIYFDVVVVNGVHNVVNRKVVSPNIPASQQDNNQIQIFFDDLGNCTSIEIISRGNVRYDIFLVDNEITRDGIEVSVMLIDVPGYDPLTLYDQTFHKN